MSEQKKKVIIIGAGISGLTAAIYAKRCGLEPELFEKNPSVGGLCTSWVRKGYTIDGCIHWLTGTKPDTDLYQMWKDTNAFKDEDLIQGDRFGTLEYNGQKFIMWNDEEKLKQEMLEISPKDKRQINHFIKLFKRIEKIDFPLHLPTSLMNFFELIKVGLKMLPSVFTVLSAASWSTRLYAKKFKSPLLRYFITNIVPGRNNLFSNIYSYATVASGNGGVPKGGSKVMAENMFKTYKDLDGSYHLATEIDEIIIEKKKAIGIRLKNGQEHYADYVVSATDIHHALTKLLKNKHYSKHFHSRFEKIHQYPIPSCIYVTYSVDLEKYHALKLGTTYQFACKEVPIAYTSQDSIRLREYSFDPSFIKDGRVPVNVMISQSDINYPFWKILARDRKAYLKEKERIGLMIKEIIERRFPSLEGDLELLDVVTPVTYHRYCNSGYGAYMSFSWTSSNNMLIHNGKFKGIRNFYVAGQWVQMPGGLPLALTTGKFAIQNILKQEKMNYRITPPKK